MAAPRPIRATSRSNLISYFTKYNFSYFDFVLNSVVFMFCWLLVRFVDFNKVRGTNFVVRASWQAFFRGNNRGQTGPIAL